MGTAIGRGEKAAVEAARQAISCALLEDSRISGSRGILINITGSSRLGLHEVNEACSIIREAANCDEVQINFGVILNESLADAVKITVIATGFQPENAPLPDRKGLQDVRFQPRLPEPVAAPLPIPSPPAPPIVERQPEPEPQFVPEVEPVMDMDDVETPAYLRQGRLLN
jgi:cell division protein FtsZ